MNDKFQKVQDLIKITNEGLTRKEFLDNFKILIDFVKKLQANFQIEVGNLDTKYAEIVKSIQEDTTANLQESKQIALTFCKQEMATMMKLVEKRMAEIKDGKDGKDADVILVAEKASEMALTELLPQIPTIESIEADLPKLGEKIRDGLELLPEGEKLRIDAIEKLEERLKELEKKIVQKNTVFVGGGGGGGRIVKSYDLSSQLNGSTTTFSLPTMWRVISVHLSSVPNILRETTDYTWTPTSITFTSEITPSTSLANGQTCVIVYSE